MSDEARSMWEAFINAPENKVLLKRYAKSAKEPAPLFESIGEDLGSTNEEVRATAFWALVAAMPELTNILHERETRSPGWRDGRGKDQQMVNRGSDILSYLHRVFVKEHRFTISGAYGKDPRPLLKRAIKNRERDAEKKRRNRDGALIEVPLDYEAALEIPDPASSVDDRVLEKRVYEERKRELRAWGFFRSDDELDLFVTVHVDERPFDEVRERLGIPSDAALRKRLSRANKNIVAGRDAVLSFLLLTGYEFAKTGKIRPIPQAPERAEEWVRRAKQSVRPGAWMEAPDGENEIAVRPLTTGLRGAPGHIYLFAIQNDNLLEEFYNHELMTYPSVLCRLYLDGDNMMACRLEQYSTEVPGLNKALAELPHDYPYAWLVSNSLPVKSYFS